MFDPMTIGVGALVWAVFRKQSKTDFGKSTPEREEVYKNAMQYCPDPERLLAIANDFQKFGLKAEAHCLRMRAKWRGRTPEQKAAHDEIFDKALASTNIKAIESVAAEFQRMTATIKAAQLRERVASLRAASERQPEQAETEAVPEQAEVPQQAEVVPKTEGQGAVNGMSRHTDENDSRTVNPPIAQA